MCYVGELGVECRRTSDVVHIVIVHAVGIGPGLNNLGIPVLAIAPAAVHE